MSIPHLWNPSQNLALHSRSAATNDTLTEFLQGLGEYEALHPSPSNPSQLIITFKQRFEAENFFFGPRDIPSVGKVEMAWVANDPSSSASGTPLKIEGDIKMEGVDDGEGRYGNGVRGGGGGGGGEREREVDFDVAEEDDFDVAS